MRTRRSRARTQGYPARQNSYGTVNSLLKLYFDSFVYNLIQKRGEAAQVRQWRKTRGHKIGASINANIMEALRITDLSERNARIETIRRVASPIHPPYDYLHYREIADEIWRLRPSWFRQLPDRRKATLFLRRQKRDWLKLRDPSQLPDLSAQLQRIQALVGRDMQRQKQHRQRPNAGADWLPEHSEPTVQACIEARTRADAFWRYVTAEESRPALDQELRQHRHLEWMTDLRWPQPLADWHRLWLCEADATRLPICRIVGLGELYQRDRQVTPGNAADRLGHAAHLSGFDYIVTTDGPFAEILEEIRAEMFGTPLARIGLIDSEAPSALAAIDGAIDTGDR